MPLTFRETLLQIASGYPSAKKTPFENPQFSTLIQKTAPEALKRFCEIPERYVWKGSKGRGKWADVPWIAVFDPLITSSAQYGYYLVYLFCADMSGIYLSLNQGSDGLKKKYPRVKNILKLQAADFCSQIREIPKGFTSGTIDLHAPSSNGRPSFYEVGNICSKFYPVEKLPEEPSLKTDFRALLSIYELLSYNETVPIGSGLQEDDETKTWIEDLRAFRQHKRIERNIRLSKEAKRIQGYSCKLCGFNFEETYGDIGRQYIEAHHLTPISELKGTRVRLDPEKDFAVLCANCHRMIHRYESPHDIEGFKNRHL